MLSHANYSIIINGILKQILNSGMDVSLSDSSATDLLSSSGHEPKSSSSSKGSLSKSSTSLVSTEDETSDEFKKPMSGRSVILCDIIYFDQRAIFRKFLHAYFWIFRKIYDFKKNTYRKKNQKEFLWTLCIMFQNG